MPDDVKPAGRMLAHHMGQGGNGDPQEADCRKGMRENLYWRARPRSIS